MKNSVVIVAALGAAAIIVLALVVPPLVIGTPTPAAGPWGSPWSPGSSMMGSMMQGGMMGGMQMMQTMMGGPYSPDARPISIDQAAVIAQRYLTSLQNPDFEVAEVEEYSNNFYFSIQQRSTGIGVYQMLIDRYTGAVYPEPGPGMMWGMWRGPTATSPTAMPISKEQAERNAERFLSTFIPGATLGEAQLFYGYYHMHVLLEGEHYGMLDVNGYTGYVWYHIWHGAFLQEKELHE